MSYPYGKRERVKLVWQDACHSSKVGLTKDAVVFEGSKRHCGEQAIKWLVQKEFVGPVDLFKLSMRMDFRLFGRFYAMAEQERRRVALEEKQVALT